ncbi:guanine nucleotide-binding protein-like 3 homolog [Branchiostoma floridae x Branchiostoma belcheri]
MVNRPFKNKQSKRLTCHKKYKIKKKIKEHNRKIRKAAKKKGTATKVSRARKDPGVPSEAPFKEQILREAQKRKQKAEEEREQRKIKRQKMLEKKRKAEKAKRDVASLQKDALKRQKAFEQKQAAMEQMEVNASSKGLKSTESSRKAFYREFRKVVEAADVVLEVVDARDPLGCRCPQVEQSILAAGPNKRIVLILNKIDLVPREMVEKWLKYLRNEFPTVAFKASTQSQTHNLSQSKVPVNLANKDLLTSSRCLGADSLMQLLNNYCRNMNIKTTISVGIIGLPNVGKSSIINSLKRSRACAVGGTPGVTKTLQEVQIDKHIKLIDSPGIVMTSGLSDAALILRNCLKVENIADVVTPVDAILRRCNKQQIMLHYGVPDYANVHEFLALLAKRQGKLKKGGVPDVDKAAKLVLQDWTIGKITYFTHPPESHSMPVHLGAEIVSEMGKAFDIGTIEKDMDKVLGNLTMETTSNMLAMESMGPMEGTMEEEEEEDEEEELEEDEEMSSEDGEGEEEEDEMDEEEDESIKHVPESNLAELSTISVKVKAKEKKSEPESVMKQKPGTSLEIPSVLEGNLQLGKAAKVAQKRRKKQQKRADKLSTQLSDSLSAAMDFGLGEDDSYNFDTDFQ